LGCRKADKVLDKETRWLVELGHDVTEVVDRRECFARVLWTPRGTKRWDEEEARRGGISAREQDSLR